MFTVGSTEREPTSPHQRCDGKRPCTACVNGEREAGCTYEPWQPPRTGTKRLPVSRNSTSGPPNPRALPPQASANGCSFPECLACPPSDIPLLTWSNSNESAPNLPTPLSHNERPLISTTQYPSELAPRSAVSSFTVLPSIHFRTIPRALRVPLLLVPPEHVRISSTARSDLDMIL